MASYTITAPDGATFDVEGDSPPTEQELEEIYAGIQTAPQTPATSPIAEQEAFKQQFIQQGTKTPLQQAFDALSTPLTVAGAVGTDLLAGARGLRNINSVGDAVQTGIEVVPRLTYDLANAARQAIASPVQTVRAVNQMVNPLGAALRALVLPQAAPTDAEAQQAFENELVNRAFQEQGKTGIAEFAQTQAGMVPVGTADIDVARAAPAVSGLVQAGPAAVRAVARGLPGALESLVTAPASRVIARLRPTASQSAMSALKLTADEVESILPVAVPAITRAAGKATPTAAEILQATPKARAALFDETTSGLQQSSNLGLVVNGRSAADDAIKALQSDARFVQDSPQELTRLLKKYEKYQTDIDPLTGRKYLQDTNSGLISYWNKTAKGQKVDLTDAEVRAERAFAANLSGQIDDLYKIGSGKAGSPYRDIGRIIELEKNLSLEKEAAEAAFAQRVAPTRVRGSSSIPQGRFEAARRVGRGITSGLRKTEIELLDTRLKEAFRGTPKRQPVADIPQDVRDVLAQRYQPSAPPTLEERITALASTYSPEIQANPALARRVAEAEIAAQPPAPEIPPVIP